MSKYPLEKAPPAGSVPLEQGQSRLLMGIFFCISVNLRNYSTREGETVASRRGYFYWCLNCICNQSAFLVFLFCVTMMEILATSKGREYHAIYVNA